jgi:aryl carrier-like protein
MENLSIDVGEVRRILERFPSLVGISETDDFFDRGLNSLSVLELQVELENRFEAKVNVTELLAKPSLQGWVEILSKSVQGEHANV